jgi:hypothetical protein
MSMSKYFLAALFLGVSTAALADDDACTAAVNKAMDMRVAATITLATASRYMHSHDDWCDGGTVAALEQQDGAAVDQAWRNAIDAQSICSQNQAAQQKLNDLIVTLHKRRLKISNTIEALKYKCQ